MEGEETEWVVKGMRIGQTEKGESAPLKQLA